MVAAPSPQRNDVGLNVIEGVDSKHEVVNTERADSVNRLHRSTSADVANMQRMGKEQKLVRHFQVFSMASFVAVATRRGSRCSMCGRLCITAAVPYWSMASCRISPASSQSTSKIFTAGSCV
uniref:Uncharacterized protein n=1 Tax=Coccidioides posadasii RMSCC 3488 TaxID=454284 RepID=A0A0J6FBB1_COCPO|nr:hypothetical protein CPAG_02878 [Coccidioides posadasii RMSCC 3488]